MKLLFTTSKGGSFTHAIKLVFCSLVFLLIFKTNTYATHFRHGSINWSVGTNDTIIFQISQTWRRTFYAGPPNVGSVVNVGSFNYGDGTTATLNLTVTSVNTVEDWFTGVATLKKKYATAGNKLAFFTGCCRISTLMGGANDQTYRNEALVTVGNNNNSPISGVPPIVNMQTNQTAATFTLPGFDPDGDPFVFALTPPVAMGGFSHPAGLTVSPTGLLTFNTVGKAVGQLWATSIRLTDNKGGYSVVDFLIKIVAQSTPPFFNYTFTPPNGSVFSVNPGTPINFNVRAQDSDPGDIVSLNATGVPAGASFSPLLPLNGNPAITNFSWTPTIANLGSYVISFTATDVNGVQTTSSVIINVNTNPVFDVPPTPADGAVFCLNTGSTYTYTVQAHNPDTNVNVRITSMAGLPSGATISPSLPTGYSQTASIVLSWTPTSAEWGYHTANFVATDVNNKSTSHQFSFMVNTLPTFTSALPTNSAPVDNIYSYTITTTDADTPFGDSLEIVSVGLPSWLTLTDNGDGTAVLNGTPSCSDTGNYNFDIIVEDVFHHCASHVEQNVSINVSDLSAPVPDIKILPTLIGECSVTVPTATATDNCYGAIMGTTTSPTTYTSQGTYTIVWNYVDAVGNSFSQTQNVIVDDNTAPVSDLAILPTVTGECSASVNAPTATDNCVGTVTGTTTNPTSYTTQGTYTITWTYDDGNGNTSSQTQTVIVDDATAPAADVASLPTVTGECSASVNAPTATDNCVGTVTGTTTNPTSYTTQGTYTITWTYDDGNGNTSSQTQTVIVDDATAPAADVASLPTVTGECSASVNAPTATDNCAGTVTGTTTNPTSYTTQGTYTITWTYDDGNGNTSSQTQTVIVNDITPPTAVCKDYTLELVNGTGSIIASDIDNGSSDNCSIADMTVSPNTFNCSNDGTNTVTLTVTDINGNTSSCNATVTVNSQPSCSINVIPANSTYTGGNPNNIYLGYGPQSATLSSTVSGGASYTYSWSPSTDLSCTNCANPTVTPTAAGTTTYTLTVINNNGCETTCLVTICVVDARATGKGNNGKVLVCHVPNGNPANAQLLSVAPSAVPIHLTSHSGDKLGSCGPTCNANNRTANAVEGQLMENGKYETIVYPNPTSGNFSITVMTESSSPITGVMYDITGKQVAALNDIVPNSQFDVNNVLPRGIYFIKIEQDGVMQNIKLIVQE